MLRLHANQLAGQIVSIDTSIYLLQLPFAVCMQVRYIQQLTFIIDPAVGNAYAGQSAAEKYPEAWLTPIFTTWQVARPPHPVLMGLAAGHPCLIPICLPLRGVRARHFLLMGSAGSNPCLSLIRLHLSKSRAWSGRMPAASLLLPSCSPREPPPPFAYWPWPHSSQNCLLFRFTVVSACACVL